MVLFYVPCKLKLKGRMFLVILKDELRSFFRKCLGAFPVWTPVRRMESPINSCPSVRPSVSNAFFSELVHLIFLIFCMKLEIHKCKKVTEPDFSGKFSFAQIWAKRAQKWTFFTFSQNSFISFFRYCARS